MRPILDPKIYTCMHMVRNLAAKFFFKGFRSQDLEWLSERERVVLYSSYHIYKALRRKDLTITRHYLVVNLGV